MPELRTLITGISFGEQPRWHEGRLWFSDWGSREVIAVDLEGNSEVILRAPSFPCCVDWLPDGRLLLVSARDGLLLRREPDGTLGTYGDLSRACKPPAGNELVVDGRGNAYVNGGGFDLMAGDPFAPGIVALVTPDGLARQVARPRIPIWADLGDGVPDGICLDAEGAVWYADVPNKRSVRVREGGEVLQRIELDRGCFACALGGSDRSTLFMVATEWNGPAGMFAEPCTGQVLTVEAPAPGVGWP